jgi:hypothetical protein
MPKIEEIVPDFSGKCVSIKLKGTTTDSIEIDNPVFECQLGRIFISGVSPEGATESGWLDGNAVSVAWDQVSEYYVFESASVFTQAAENIRAFYKVI